MPGLLIDTHTLLWLDENTAISRHAELALAQAQSRNQLHVSVVSAWEIGVASQKKNLRSRPNLGGRAPENFFINAVTRLSAIVMPLTLEIATETARLPRLYGSGDPGDCFLIATAHVHQLTLITRDGPILKFAASHPGYLSALAC